MTLDPSKLEPGDLVSPFAHVTRSALAQRLMEDEAKSSDLEGRRTVVIPFEGDGDAAHRKTRSIRTTMARHGYRLTYKREPGHLRLWAVKDSTIDRKLYITRPRVKPQ